MSIDLSRFKVVHDGKVLNALSLESVEYSENTDWNAVRKKPNIIEILVINEDGNIETLNDETWRFQFIPILNK